MDATSNTGPTRGMTRRQWKSTELARSGTIVAMCFFLRWMYQTTLGSRPFLTTRNNYDFEGTANPSPS